MILTGETPFKILKTHGLIVDELGEKISKSKGNSQFADPLDLIEGSIKSDGNRKYGYGLDVLRAWCAFKDSDRNIFVVKEQLDQVNKEIKLFRDVVRVLLMNIQTLDINKEVFSFNDLSVIDKHMMTKLLSYCLKITQAYEAFDLKAVYETTMEFTVRDVVNFYLEFSKHRKQESSTKQVMQRIFQTLLLTSAPVICFSA